MIIIIIVLFRDVMRSGQGCAVNYLRRKFFHTLGFEPISWNEVLVAYPTTVSVADASNDISLYRK